MKFLGSKFIFPIDLLTGPFENKHGTRTKDISNTENENRTRTKKKYACSFIPEPKYEFMIKHTGSVVKERNFSRRIFECTDV